FNAALAALDERAIVPLDGARTPGEYQRRVRAILGAAATPFDDLVARFVPACFAPAPPARSDYDTALAAFDRLMPPLAGA
ncbi:MAG: DUF4129 domain-containing protein, partial [Vulcanimicrobiaceae bacterium]